MLRFNLQGPELFGKNEKHIHRNRNVTVNNRFNFGNPLSWVIDLLKAPGGLELLVFINVTVGLLLVEMKKNKKAK